MEYPTIKILNLKSKFKYLWLKYVDSYNLNEHCAKSLIGTYSKKINKEINEFKNIELNESNSNIYYLCGVSDPFNYSKNFHLSFKYKKNSQINIEENGIEIKIENAERILITKQNYIHEKANLKSFNTCRNWQFAYQQNTEPTPNK